MSRWIKIDVETPHKRQLAVIMDVCGVSRGEAFLAFFTFFAWVDELTADGFVFLTVAEIDNRVGLPGFTAAMIQCGWLQEAAGGFQIVNFKEHNGKSAKARAMTAKRLANLRCRKAHTIPPPMRT